MYKASSAWLSSLTPEDDLLLQAQAEQKGEFPRKLQSDSFWYDKNWFCATFSGSAPTCSCLCMPEQPEGETAGQAETICTGKRSSCFFPWVIAATVPLSKASPLCPSGACKLCKTSVAERQFESSQNCSEKALYGAINAAAAAAMVQA